MMHERSLLSSISTSKRDNKMIMQLKLLILMLLFGAIKLAHAQLAVNFYDQKCPNVTSIASSRFQSLATNDNVVAPSTLRLIIHDCFTQGCDASILISSTSVNRAEREAEDNDIPQQAFDTINTIKKDLDIACPGVVSCADIIALAARDSVIFFGGPSWQVPLGRRDSLVSQEAMVQGNLPTSKMNVSQLISIFASKGLDLQDLVALSGAHTVGFSKCRQFSYRFNKTQGVDSTLDSAYAQQLQGECSTSGGENPVAFDPPSAFGFDNSYYRGLQAGRGLLFSDQVLFVDNATRGSVNLFASNQTQFFQFFVDSMIKMSSIGVLTGKSGEIRRDCTAVNAVPIA